jgi:hypothetical protein
MDPDPGGPKTCGSGGSGSATLLFLHFCLEVKNDIGNGALGQVPRGEWRHHQHVLLHLVLRRLWSLINIKETAIPDPDSGFRKTGGRPQRRKMTTKKEIPAPYNDAWTCPWLFLHGGIDSTRQVTSKDPDLDLNDKSTLFFNRFHDANKKISFFACLLLTASTKFTSVFKDDEVTKK